LNNLVTSLLVLDGSGQVKEYIGGYDDWQKQSQAEKAELPPASGPAPRKPAAILRASLPKETPSNAAAPRKLTYKEKRALEAQRRELAELPGRIEALEIEQHQLTTAMADPIFYQRDNAEIVQAAKRLKEIEEELAKAYERWEELEQG
jgi:ATP-binding cassette subfamily F protein uup